MLKHELRTSEKVAAWPFEIRYFWVLLWGYLDDYGKGKDNLLPIRSDCFPLDAELTPEIIDGWLWRMAGDGVIVRYTVDGANYLAAVNWSEHQKPQHPTASKVPDWNDAVIRVNHSVVPHEDDGKTLHSLVKSELGLEGGDPRSLSPFCPLHPRGTTDRCRDCGNARRSFDAAQKQEATKLTPGPPRKEDLCPNHEWLLKTQCKECFP